MVGATMSTPNAAPGLPDTIAKSPAANSTAHVRKKRLLLRGLGFMVATSNLGFSEHA
jgi:hypothetical protein